GRQGLIPGLEWLASVAALYRRGLAAFPRSLALRFNLVRILLHFGSTKQQAEGLALADKTLRTPAGEWSLDVMDDVFPWDFFPQLFNYRSYFDQATRSLADGGDAGPALRRLIYASLHYYRGFFVGYEGFHGGGLRHFRHAVELDPAFPYYQYHLACE